MQVRVAAAKSSSNGLLSLGGGDDGFRAKPFHKTLKRLMKLRRGEELNPNVHTESVVIVSLTPRSAHPGLFRK